MKFSPKLLWKNGVASEMTHIFDNNVVFFLLQVNRPLFLYSFGRPSVIWPVSRAALNGKMSSRLEALAKPKRPSSENLDPK